MSTTSTRATLRNVAANYGGYLANILITFFLTPYVIHSLGDIWYGVWTILMSIAGSMGLVELGVVATSGRMINYHLGAKAQDKVNGIASLSLLIFLSIAPLLLAVAWFSRDTLVGGIKDIPPQDLRIAGYAIAILALNIGLGLINSLFAVLLQAKDRFDLKNGVDVTALTLRSLGTVWVLDAGYGIWGLAWVTLGASLLSLGSMVMLARYKGHWPRFGPSWIHKDTLQSMFHFAGWAFIDQAASRLFLYTNSIVIGMVSGAKDVTYFTIALALVDYAQTLSVQVISALTPEMHRAAGSGDHARVRAAVSNTLQLACALGLPIMLGLVFFANDFIGLWVGEKYAATAGLIAIILTLARLSALINGPLGLTIWSLGKIKITASANLTMAIANAIGSYLVLRHTDWGLTGVAVVSAIAILVVNALVIPYYGTRLLGWPLSNYLKTLMRWPLPALASYALIAYALVSGQWIHNWPSFIAIGLLSLLLFAPIAWLLLIKPFLAGRRQLQQSTS